jgi:glycosyltransferase involved in cell wall biosynthesis
MSADGQSGDPSVVTRNRRTVLVFAHECAPYNRPESTVAAQRPAQFAKYIPHYGWRAIVVCCDASARGAARPEGLDTAVAEALRYVRDASPAASVVVPTPSYSSHGLVDRLWRAADNGGRPLARKALTVTKFPQGDYSYPWQPVARAVARRIAATVRVDACIGEHSPDAGLFLARWFSKEFGVPWVADFRDPILQPLTPAARTIYRPIARRIVSTASCTVNVTDAWSRLDRELFEKTAHTIPNGFDPEEFDVEAAPAGGGFRIVYMGRVDALQRMDLFLQGLRIARERVGNGFCDVSFVYRGYAAPAVVRMAEAAGVTDIVDAGEHVDRSLALAFMRGAHLLLLLSLRHDDAFFARGFLPAKTFEYFGARRPILCVPGDGGLLDELLRETRTGVVCETPDAIARHVIDAYQAWREGSAMSYVPDAEAVSRFTRRSQAAQLASVLDSIVPTA